MRHTGPLPNPDQDQIDDAVPAAIAVTKERGTQVLNRIRAPELAATQIPVRGPAAVCVESLQVPPRPGDAGVTEAEWQAMRANRRMTIAHEFTADLKNLSPAERATATNHATVLYAVANELLSGQATPPPRPDDANFKT